MLYLINTLWAPAMGQEGYLSSWLWMGNTSIHSVICENNSETGTLHSPLKLGAIFGPVFTLSVACILTKLQNITNFFSNEKDHH